VEKDILKDLKYPAEDNIDEIYRSVQLNLNFKCVKYLYTYLQYALYSVFIILELILCDVFI